ncbi:MAG: hypothetical protein ACJA2M_001852 [Polaribacter sp.]|jgi:hypothetical protein
MNTKHFLIFLFAFFSLQVSSQDYEPLLKDGSFWDFEVWEGQGAPCTINKRRYLVDQDTLINGNIYKKVFVNPIQGTPVTSFPMCLQGPFHYNSNFFHQEDRYLREDVDNKIVYIWTKVEDPNGNLSNYKELILYNFDVEVGDVIENSYKLMDFGYVYGASYGDSNGITEIVLEVTYYNGKKIITTSASEYIEGIGQEGSLFKAGPFAGGSQQNLFCSGNAQNQNNCAEVLSTEKYELTSIKAYPNPVKNILNIKNTEDVTVKIFSVTGSLLKMMKSKTDLKVDFSSLQNGIYILETSNFKGKNRSKILKL